ncbi:VOC family protein [Rhodobacteraceae bacterium]|nr:VOC family protein [Paracoccaceae bacterium]
MLTQIKGLHHVTSVASSARGNNAFFTDVLGLRRVKTTVNFDAPDVYHLYYGDEAGTPGSVMTYFPFPNTARGKKGVGEIGRTAFSVPKGTLQAWADRLAALDTKNMSQDTRFGEDRLLFDGPDGDSFALIGVKDDNRIPWTGNGVASNIAIRGFHSTDMRLSDAAASTELLTFMGYEQIDRTDNITRFAVPGGNEANVIDIETLSAAPSDQGAGSVHHIAFAVDNRARQLEVREALLDTGYQVTPVINRDYFWAIYFRAPGGVLFEIATNEPGFNVDEDTAHLGEALRLPSQHEHLREKLERSLEPLA